MATNTNNAKNIAAFKILSKIKELEGDIDLNNSGEGIKAKLKKIDKINKRNSQQLVKF